MKAMLGRKIGMSQIFSPEGEVIVAIRRLEDRDGYSAIQLALPKDPTKKDVTYAACREFDITLPEDTKEVTVAQFEAGDMVQVSGISKGKGFQGVVKLHGFHGGPKTHGHRHVLRKPGSIGCRFPQHVRKGKRMAARMGADTITVKNLRIVSIDQEKNLLAIKGALPGKRGSVVEIQTVAD
jgi:large subunit ribosomal protein L3